MKILVTGGGGALAKEIAKVDTPHEIILADRDECDVADFQLVEGSLLDWKPDAVLHCAAMTNPMERHDKYPDYSIEANIIGTSNVAMAIIKNPKVNKLIYISTDYVYDGRLAVPEKHSEHAGLKPDTNYGRSKLGGEMAAQMVKNSLVLRCAFTPRPFKHEKAFIDAYKSFIYIDEAAPIILKLIERGATGIVNVGGEGRSIYEFAAETNPDVGKASILYADYDVPVNTMMDTSHMNFLLTSTNLDE
jgi:dTDP-4-dehydrorhamnose reductase